MNGILRPEARPQRIEDLTRSQRKALGQILPALQSAVDSLRFRESPEKVDSSLDKDRSSRIFFLSGEAGTGKTTVYLSLRAEIEEKKPSTAPSEELTKLVDRLGRLHDKVVWLEPLDLEAVAGETTNYLAAVLARVDDVLARQLGGGSGESGRPPDLFGHGKLSEAMGEFQRLRTDIGLAWDGNLPRRGEHLDPDAFAEEVMRAEAARMHVRGRLDKVLEELTRELFRWSPGPLLVLPIDDLSINPGPSLEILRLLRMISVPRIFVLAMGDAENLEELGFQQLLGELVGLSGDYSLKVDRQQRVLMARARSMAFEAQRKLLPPGQRATLEVLYWDETLVLSPRDSTSKANSDACKRDLASLLKGWYLPELEIELGATQLDSNNMYNFLIFPRELEALNGEGMTTKRQADLENIYTGQQIFEIPYRSALDLWIETERIAAVYSENEKQENHDRLFRWLVDQALRVLNEQNYMSGIDRERCEEAIRGTQYTSSKLDTKVLEAHADHGTEISIGIAGNRRGCLPELLIKPHRRWRIGPRANQIEQEKTSQPGSWRFMPPRPTAWFILLHDMLVLTRGEGLLGDPLTPEWGAQEWAQTRWSRVYSVNRARRDVFSVRWPIPSWPSFWQFDSFLCAWNHIVRLAAEPVEVEEGSEPLNDSLVYWWIRLAVSVFLLEGVERRVFMEVKSENWKNASDLFGGSSSSRWEGLKNRIDELCASFSKAERPDAIADAERWLAHLGAMMAPEYALPSERISGLKLDLWDKPEVASYIREIRAENLEQFLKEDLEPCPAWEEQIRWEQDTLIFGSENDPASAELVSRSWNPSRAEIKAARNYHRQNSCGHGSEKDVSAPTIGCGKP